ncbi:general transcription factor IIH subunit 4 isoform X2 [Petromyzon marinus]|uniref:General transcription factor IIH subunit 4 n=1 Tax=Petromyzon marinus TaxID=7757 RepID=A0AAJ7SX28_PETMA|nr:general transcription factor IIH subunit 4 isoform X2 [Petromyzon marinus]
MASSGAGPAGSAGNHNNSAAANSGRAASRGLLACRNLHEFLRGLEARALDRLYAHPAPCLALLRELSPLARNYVMRMLFLETPLPTAAIDSWVCKDAQNGNPWSDDTTGLGPDKHARDVTSLDRYALERWEVILHFMVGSPGAEVSADVAQLLIKAGLMRSETGEPPCITSAGFQFLLLDTASQVWYFMLQYLNSTETRGMDLVEILSFLFQLSFSTLGKDYSVEGMSESLLNFLQHLREFGMVFQRKRKSRRYYPTRLAINLASGISQGSTDVHQQGYLVVETNYRVYAYTDSELQVALVALFCEMLYRFPNLVVAQVTRESVQQAIANGITAEQIIHFLRTHAHPEMMKQTPVLPPTITDQIRLWEMERDRLVFTEGVLYSQFLSQADYEVLCVRAKELGVLQWECAARRLMVVTPAGHTDVKRFWKRQKNS